EAGFSARLTRGDRAEIAELARGRLRSAKRALLLARRPPALRERHGSPAHPRLRREERRHPDRWARVGGDEGGRQGRARRNEARLAEQRLLLRTGRDPRLQPRGRRSRRHPGARAHGQHGLRRRRSPLPVHHGFDLGIPYSRACPGAAGALSDTVARALILKENVDFLVGTLTSAEGPAVSAIAKEQKVVFIAPIPKTDQLTAADKLHPYVFRVAATTTMEGRSAAEIVAKWPVTQI